MTFDLVLSEVEQVKPNKPGAGDVFRYASSAPGPQRYNIYYKKVNFWYLFHLLTMSIIDDF